MRSVAEIQADIERMEDVMFRASMSDNFYYISGRYDTHNDHLLKLKAELEQAQDNG